MNLTQSELNELSWATAKVVASLAGQYAPHTDGLVTVTELVDKGEKVPCDQSTPTSDLESEACSALLQDGPASPQSSTPCVENDDQGDWPADVEQFDRSQSIDVDELDLAKHPDVMEQMGLPPVPPQPTLWHQEGGSQSELAQAQAAHREKIGDDEPGKLSDNDQDEQTTG